MSPLYHFLAPHLINSSKFSPLARSLSAKNVPFMITRRFCQGGPHHNPIDDLKVTMENSSLIFSPYASERKSMFLSNLDQPLNYDMRKIQFFQAHPQYPSHVVAERIKLALQKMLVPYDFLSGRMRSSPQSDRLEFDCNNAGMGFVVAKSDRSLEELGDLVYPNPAFGQLISPSTDGLITHDRPLFTIQVTSFKCGGFAIGFQNIHTAFDGTSFRIFLENLAASAANKPLVTTPCNDRELLAARSPPRVTFPHPELRDPNTTDPTTNHVLDTTPQDLDFNVFRLTRDQISHLKAKASANLANTKARATRFNVVTALVWRCKALLLGGHDSNELSTLLYAVDIRSRLSPTLPVSFTGNALLVAYATARKGELEKAPLSELVERVWEGSNRITDEYARSTIDWAELNRWDIKGDFFMSSWLRLGYNEVEYPWGRPKYTCPLMHKMKNLVFLFPDAASNGGINVLVALSHEEKDKFETLFHHFLSN